MQSITIQGPYNATSAGPSQLSLAVRPEGADVSGALTTESLDGSTGSVTMVTADLPPGGSGDQRGQDARPADFHQRREFNHQPANARLGPRSADDEGGFRLIRNAARGAEPERVQESSQEP